MSAKPSTRVIATAAGNTVPPWKRTLRPLPFCASLAAFFVELGLATTGQAIGAAAPSACDGGRRRRATRKPRTHRPRLGTLHAEPTGALQHPSPLRARHRRQRCATPLAAR